MRLKFIACKYTHFIQNTFYSKVTFLLNDEIYPKENVPFQSTPIYT